MAAFFCARKTPRCVWPGPAHAVDPRIQAPETGCNLHCILTAEKPVGLQNERLSPSETRAATAIMGGNAGAAERTFFVARLCEESSYR